MEDGIPRWLQHCYKTCCKKSSCHGRQACMIRRWFHCGDIISRQVDLHMTMFHFVTLVVFPYLFIFPWLSAFFCQMSIYIAIETSWSSVFIKAISSFPNIHECSSSSKHCFCFCFIVMSTFHRFISLSY